MWRCRLLQCYRGTTGLLPPIYNSSAVLTQATTGLPRYGTTGVLPPRYCRLLRCYCSAIAGYFDVTTALLYDT